MTGFFEKVYQKVRSIPEGKVATYGQIADSLGTKDARKIGWALHANRDPKTPCHRVVSREGRLAENYGAFLSRGQSASGGGDYKEHKARLVVEGVIFKDERHVDLNKALWNI